MVSFSPRFQDTSRAQAVTLEENWAPPEYPKTEDEERRLQVCTLGPLCVGLRV